MDLDRDANMKQRESRQDARGRIGLDVTYRQRTCPRPQVCPRVRQHSPSEKHACVVLVVLRRPARRRLFAVRMHAACLRACSTSIAPESLRAGRRPFPDASLQSAPHLAGRFLGTCCWRSAAARRATSSSRSEDLSEISASCVIVSLSSRTQTSKHTVCVRVHSYNV